ncbi:DUF2314 domain-containing protein [Myxococcaceae bacterium GXIMD 01537]
MVVLPVLPRRVWAAAASLLLLTGCFRHAAQPGPSSSVEFVPPGTLFAPRATFSVALFLPPGSTASALPRVAELVGPRFAPLQLVREGADSASSGATVRAREATLSEYPLPEGEMMETAVSRLSPQEQGQLAASERVLVLDFTLAPPSGEAQRQANALALELARLTGGLLWDAEVGEFASAEVWQRRRVEGWSEGVPLMANHFNARLYSLEDGRVEFITAGLSKFGLPELAVAGVPGPVVDEMGMFLNVLAQRMMEGAQVDKDRRFAVDLRELRFEPLRKQLLEGGALDARLRTEVSFVNAESGELAPGQRLVEVRFLVPWEGTESERLYQSLKELFGTRDSLVPTEHDEVLMAASQRAREVLLERVKPRFLEGLEPGARLFVKAPFDTARGGTEWMWLQVFGWKGAAIEGVLDSDPRAVPGLRAGSRVTVQEASLFDYLLTWPDGTTEGNQTERIILERAGGL